MDLKIIKQFINIKQLILIISLGYIGLFFTGRVDYEVWILFTLALFCARIVHLSFKFILKDKDKILSINDIFINDKKTSAAFFYGVISSALFIFLSFLINELCYFTSIISVIILIGFPLLRRYTSLLWFNTGLFEAICPIGGFIAANNRFELIPFVLFASVILWTTGIQISGSIYENRNNKNNSNYLLGRFSAGRAQFISVILFIFSVCLLILAGFTAERGLAYWISLVCLVIIFIRQEVLLRSKDVETAKTEFMQINNFTAPLLLIGILIDIFYR